MSSFFVNFPGTFLFYAIPLGLGGAILVFYFLKLRRNEVTVSSTILWRKSLEDLRVNAPFQILRKNILLFLQLLILFLLIFSFYRPWVRGTRVQARSAVILVDASASMGAKEEGTTRLDKAKKKTRELIESLTGDKDKNHEVMVVSFSDRAKIVSTFTSDTTSLVDRLDSIEQTDTETSLQDALDSAAALLMDRPGGEVFIISDGAFGELKRPDDLSSEINFLPVGQNASNIAVTAMDVRRSPEALDEFQVFVSVDNLSSEKFNGDLDVYFDGRLIDSAEIVVPPGASNSKVFGDFRFNREAIVKVVLQAADSLACDNVAYQVVKPGKKYKTLHVYRDKENYFLDRLFKADPLSELVSISHGVYEEEVGSERASEYDLVIFEGYAPERLGAGNYLFLGAVPVAAGFENQGITEDPYIIFSDSTHPVMNMAVFENVRLARALNVTLPRDAVSLVEASNGPIVAALFEKNRRIVYVGFDMWESTWPLKSSFPVFITNVLRYLADLERGMKEFKITPGRTITLFAPGETTELVVKAPDGGEHRLKPSEPGRFQFSNTDKCGIYSFHEPQSEGKKYFAVNLLSPMESDLKVSESFRLGSSVVESAGLEVEENREIWKILALLGLLVLLAEWYVYNRKVRI